MNRLCVFVLLLVSCPCFAQKSVTISAPPVDAETAKQHLRIAPQPVAPPLARAVGTPVAVVLQIEISPEGRVVQEKVISGTAILQPAAIDAVKKWFYTPFAIDGKPAAVSTMVTFPFEQQRSDPNDAKIEQTFAPLDKKCVDAINKQVPPAEQADACGKAAAVADSFATDHFVERRQAYILNATALLRNQNLKDALIWAEKTVAEVLQDRDDSAGASAAYSVRAQVRAVNGDLAGSDQDLTISEDFERQAIATSDNKSAQASFVSGLKQVLNFHAQVLKVMKRPADAQVKLDEAAKL